MSGVLLDPLSLSSRVIRDEQERRRAQLDVLLYAVRRDWEGYCFAPSPQVLAQGAVLSILNDRLYADLARRARKPSPATADPGDRRPGSTVRRPSAKRRRGRRL